MNGGFEADTVEADIVEVDDVGEALAGTFGKSFASLDPADLQEPLKDVTVSKSDAEVAVVHPSHVSFLKAHEADSSKAPAFGTSSPYGCRVGKEAIVWYVDGVEVGRKANKFWHRPMSVALSLGVRAPFVKWENNRGVVNEEAGKGAFPTTRWVEYVRVWELDEKAE